MGFLAEKENKAVVPTKTREILLLRKFKGYATERVSFCSSSLPISCSP